MFIRYASIDDNDTYVEREHVAEDLTRSLVAELVRSLDGERHTLVTLSPGVKPIWQLAVMRIST
jgi:hypothetical protein